VYLAARDPRVPWYAKLVAFLVAGYVVSPIDLIPDFIPAIGYLDDLVIVPLGILLVIYLAPPELMAEHRTAALGYRSNVVVLLFLLSPPQLNCRGAGWLLERASGLVESAVAERARP